MDRLTAFFAYNKKSLVINDLPDVRKIQFLRLSKHNQTFCKPYSPDLDYLRHSFLYTTIGDWNNLTQDHVDADSKEQFKKRIAVSFGWGP